MRGLWGLGLALGLSVLAFNAGVYAGSSRVVGIATGGTGGLYYPLGSSMAELLNAHVPGIQAIPRVTGGSVDNLKLIGLQQSNMAIVTADAALSAVIGEGKFKSGRIDTRLLMVLFASRMHLVTVEGRGIATMADLKGKRVSTGAPDSATEVMAVRVLDGVGLDREKDIVRRRLGMSESIDELKDGKLDAFFWVGSLPTVPIAELAATQGVKLRLIDHGDVLDRMNAKHGQVYTASVIPAGTYEGQDKDIRVTAVQNILVADARMHEQSAYEIARALFEHRADIAAVVAEAKGIELANQARPSPAIEWHPGAATYFSAKGARM